MLDYTLDDLPQAIEGFKNSLKSVIMLEKLSNPNWKFYIRKEDFKWVVVVTGLPTIAVPFNASSHTPPMTQFLLYEKNTDEFLLKLQQSGLISVGSSGRGNKLHSFIFDNEDSVYNFYIISHEYNMF